MPYYLPENAIRRAILHIAKYGDTDIFPNLAEIAFFKDKIDDVTAELSTLDLNSYNPGGALESLAPKSRYGFRIAHQLMPVDTVLYIAATLAIADQIEEFRVPSPNAFSYRYNDSDDGEIFAPAQSYRDWLNYHKKVIDDDLFGDIKYVISTDISDFYQRINFHRLENYLNNWSNHKGAANYIKKYIKKIRAKQSFGLPVGGVASRLLAELILTDTDKELIDFEYEFSRFVDDFRIFIKADTDPYEALALLAEQLATNEGLSLNVAKTKVQSVEDFASSLNKSLADVSGDAEEAAIEILTADIYLEEEPDPDDIAKLSHLNLVEHLSEELENEYWDHSKIRVLFRALRITQHEDSIVFISENFEKLLIFSKDLVLLMEALNETSPGCFNHLIDRIIASILSPPAASVQLIQCWLMEIFVRRVISISATKLKKLEVLHSSLLARQVIRIKHSRADVNFFRKQKTKIEEFSDIEKYSLVQGASCLPKDELKNWIPSVRVKFKFPTSDLFYEWVQED